MRDRLEQLFDMYINMGIDINDLQNRISMIECNSHKEMEQIRLLDNQLEEIIYCNKIDNQYKKVLQVINGFFDNPLA